MIIETKVNFRLRDGKGILKAGVHNDNEVPFPTEIHEEIERNLNGERHTLRIISDETKFMKKKLPKELNTIDSEAEVSTSDRRKKRRKR